MYSSNIGDRGESIFTWRTLLFTLLLGSFSTFMDWKRHKNPKEYIITFLFFLMFFFIISLHILFQFPKFFFN
ncbi:DUF4181 domain-containing protein [Bacillus sp. FJAT-45350]|uniref:DUF4181 domain-containing protein n=1 Tax=Bacillus sp. FJAT-45350 TaxID=2011014 RepID=UPI00359C12BF